MQRISSFNLLILEIQSILGTRLATPTFDHSRPNFFDQLLIYANLYQYVKNQAISLICSGDMFD